MSYESLMFEQGLPPDVVAVNGNYTYMGWFRPGNSDYNQPNCMIVRIEDTGTQTIRTYAEGVKSYTNTWNNREGFNYSHLK